MHQTVNHAKDTTHENALHSDPTIISSRNREREEIRWQGTE